MSFAPTTYPYWLGAYPRSGQGGGDIPAEVDGAYIVGLEGVWVAQLDPISLGNTNTSQNTVCIGLDAETTVNGGGSIAIGRAAKAYDEATTVVGYSSIATARNTTIIGTGSLADGANTIIVGLGNHTTLPNTTIIGNNITTDILGAGLYIDNINPGTGSAVLQYDPTSKVVSYTSQVANSVGVQNLVALVTDPVGGAGPVNLVVRSYYGDCLRSDTVFTALLGDSTLGDTKVADLKYNGTYFLISINFNNTDTIFYKSANGITWSTYTLPSVVINALNYHAAGGAWYGSALSTACYVSYDGLNWAAVSPFPIGVVGYCGCDSMYPAGNVSLNMIGGIVQGSAGFAFNYNDGLGWRLSSPLPSPDYANIPISGIAVASGSANATIVATLSSVLQQSTAVACLVYSTDYGLTWTPDASTDTPTLNNFTLEAIAYNGDIWIAVGKNFFTTASVALYSRNGYNDWTFCEAMPFVPQNRLTSITWNGYCFQVVGTEANFITLNGVDWVQQVAPDTDQTSALSRIYVASRQVKWGSRIF